MENAGARWLGGEGSDALTGDSKLGDMLLFGEHARAKDSFDVWHEPGAYHHAIVTPDPATRSDPESIFDELLSQVPASRYSR